MPSITSRFARERRPFAAALSVALALASGAASANDWLNTGLGDWFAAGNWSDGVAPTTYFGVANVYRGQALVLGAGAEAFIVQVGYPGSSTGNILVGGPGVLTVHDTLGIGQGTVQVLGGGHLNLNSNPLGGARTIEISVPGRLLVDGAGSTVDTGSLDTSGTITVQDAGHLFGRFGTTSGGTIGVDGAGSLFQQTGTLSLFGSSSALRVTNGGEVDADYVDALSGASALVSGSGSTLNLTGTAGDTGFRIGEGASGGSVSVANGGLLISHGAAIRGDGFTASGDPDAQVSVSGTNSTWFNFGALNVGGGSEGVGTGLLSIGAGATVVGQGAALGNQAGSYGKATIDGAGASWIASGDLIVGNQATGILQITNGGTLSSTGGFIGNDAASLGAVSLSGAGSSWNVNGALVIGSSGNGQLSVTDHAVVGIGGSALVGSASGSQGLVDINGAGATWNILAAGSSLNIGGSPLGAGGNGTVEVENGGTINTRQTNLYRTGTLFIGDDGRFNGHITADGGQITTMGTNTLNSAITLNAGGVFVRTSSYLSVATFNGDIDGVGGLVKNAFLGSGGGTLVLAGTNTYTGATRVDLGTLIVNGSSVSATTVTKGTLGGNGAIAAAVQIGDGTGVGDAVLAPGQGIGRLATGDLSFASDGAFAFQIDSAAGTADQVAVSGGVTIADGALFLFDDLSNALLAVGTQFVAIDNDGLDAIVGRFANLLDGSVFDFGMNEFSVNYAGGTGNDLVLTVFGNSTNPPPTTTVPEPPIGLLMGAGVIAMVYETRRRSALRRRDRPEPW